MNACIQLSLFFILSILRQPNHEEKQGFFELVLLVRIGADL